MRVIVLVLASAFLCGGQAYAQLEKLLAPVSLATAEPVAGAGSRPAPTPSLHRLAPDEVLPQLEKQLQERFSLEGELKLQNPAPWAKIIVPGDYDLTVADYPGGGVTSSFVVGCRLTAQGKSLGQFQVPLRAQLWREVWVADGRLDRGQAIDRSLISVQKVDVLRERDSLIPASVDPTIYDLAQTVIPGRPLTRRDVSERPIIHKGEVVDVVARQGAFSIHMKALALEDGASRTLIKLRNLESRRDFTAEVINESQVEVHF